MPGAISVPERRRLLRDLPRTLSRPRREIARYRGRARSASRGGCTCTAASSTRLRMVLEHSRLKDELLSQEARQDDVKRKLQEPEAPPLLHPSVADLYWEKVTGRCDALEGDDRVWRGPAKPFAA